jgi:hypothetical protein
VPLSPRRLPRQFNRSVTSSTRNLVRARHERRKQYSRERWQRGYQRLKRQFVGWRVLVWRFLAVLAVGCVALGVWLVFFSRIFAVSEIRVARTDRRLNEEMIYDALRPLIGRHLFYVSEGEVRPMLTAPSDRAGRPAVPDLDDVVVGKDYPNAVGVRIELDPVIARLSIEGGAPRPEGGTGSGLGDFLTDKGMYVAYQPSQVASGAQLPLIRIVDWGIRPTPWATLLEPAFLDGMRKAEQSLNEQFGQRVTERAVYLRAREFHLKTGAHSLWFDFKSTLEAHLQRYRLFLRAVGAGGAKQYVDLRLTERIVYR